MRLVVGGAVGLVHVSLFRHGGNEFLRGLLFAAPPAGERGLRVFLLRPVHSNVPSATSCASSRALLSRLYDPMGALPVFHF